jgi:hypothetical protein
VRRGVQSIVRAAAVARQGVSRAGKRFSHDMPQEELASSAGLWWKVSLAGLLAVSLPYTAAMVVVESSHHEHEHHHFRHMKVRARAGGGRGARGRARPAAAHGT